MVLRIRLARSGAKKRPFYRIVLADARAPRDGRFIEKLGTYNPLIAKDAPVNDEAEKVGRIRLKMDEERIKLWLSRGAQPSPRVARFLEIANLIKPKKRDNPKKAKPKAKAQARIEAASAAAAAASDAAASDAETEAAVETPEAEVKTTDATAADAVASDTAAVDAAASDAAASPPSDDTPSDNDDAAK